MRATIGHEIVPLLCPSMMNPEALSTEFKLPIWRIQGDDNEEVCEKGFQVH